MRRVLFLFGTIILIAAVIGACGGDNATDSSNRAPDQPTLDGPSGAPINGATGVSLTPTLRWTCTDPDGDALTYTVSFGTSTPPSAVSTDQSNSSYSPTSLTYSTRYYWSVTAKDTDGATTSSDEWNFTTTATPAVETITVPDAPSGPATGEENQALTYTASGAVSSFGDALEYRFEWGDGNFSAWGTTGVENFWASAGAYHVKAQARCIDHPAVISDWSDAMTVTITTPEVETVTAPSAPDGPTTGETNYSLDYLITGAESSKGHALEYRFDWGDGPLSLWSPSTNGGHGWSSAGTYDVKVMARCVEHTDIESAWSAATTVTITEVVETVTAPGTPSGFAGADVGQTIHFTTDAATSSKGHDLHYRFDFGDGTISNWFLIRASSHAWANAGTYEVKAQARCADHNEILSDWSSIKSVLISVPAAETVSIPDAPTFTDSTLVSVAVVFTVTGSTSSDGHPVQYQVDFGDGTVTWFAYNATIFNIYDEAGSYMVKAMARCNTHNDIISGWSEEVTVVIVNPPEALAYNTKLVSGDVVEGNIGESYEYIVSHSPTTNLGDPMEGQYNWGDGTTSAWVQAADRLQSHAWTAEGTYGITYTGRCTVHNDFTFTTDTLWVTMVTEATETVATPRYINWQDAQDRPMLDVETIYYAYGGLSSLGHDTESRISWGDGDTTGWVPANTQILKTWTVLGTFLLSRQSRCIEHPDVISEWSETSFIITGPETVSAPDRPEGPATGPKMQYLYFTGGGASSSWGHSNYIEYRYDYGDGSALSIWTTNPDGSHRYNLIGEFEVKAQARCSWPTGHENPESEWSLPALVTIIETISGNYIYGPEAGPINRDYTFEVRGATSDVSHTLEYQIDFGDGTITDWSLAATADHMYSTAGIFDVLGRARCAEHTEAVSDWSTGHDMAITDAPETVAEPAIPQISVFGNVYKAGLEFSLYVRDAQSDYGDSLEYQVDYGDGTVTEWIAATYSSYYGYILSTTYTYSDAGSYDIIARARCAIHTSVVSDWSITRDITVFESIAPPSAPTGPTIGVVDDSLTFTTADDAISSEGHTLEYAFVYYRGSSYLGTSGYSTSLSHSRSFSQAGAHKVYVVARCQEHPFIYSVFSGALDFAVTEE